MTKDAIARRNRRNAQLSTGPRTDHGKNIAAYNAFKHGATSAPDPELAAKFLAVILGAPDISLETYLPSDDQGFAALRLAEAEAILVRSQAALQSFEAGIPDDSEGGSEIEWMQVAMMDAFMEGEHSAQQVREFQSIMRGLYRAEANERRRGSKRHRLLKRYLREAQTGRTRALKNWVRVNAGAA